MADYDLTPKENRRYNDLPEGFVLGTNQNSNHKLANTHEVIIFHKDIEADKHRHYLKTVPDIALDIFCDTVCEYIIVELDKGIAPKIIADNLRAKYQDDNENNNYELDCLKQDFNELKDLKEAFDNKWEIICKKMEML